MQSPCGSMEDGVAVREHSTVGGDEPIAASVGRGGHGDHRSIEAQGSGGAVEHGVTVGEHAAIGGHQPIPAAVGCGRHADDWRAEMQTPADPWNTASP